MITHLLQHIIIVIIIALAIQMIVHHLQIREDVMGAVEEIKKALLSKGLLINLR